MSAWILVPLQQCCPQMYPLLLLCCYTMYEYVTAVVLLILLLRLVYSLTVSPSSPPVLLSNTRQVNLRTACTV